MPEPLILPAPAVDCSQPLRHRGRRPAPEARVSSGRPVGVAAILVLVALTASLVGAGLTYQLRHGAGPVSPVGEVKAST